MKAKKVRFKNTRARGKVKKFLLRSMGFGVRLIALNFFVKFILTAKA